MKPSTVLRATFLAAAPVLLVSTGAREAGAADAPAETPILVELFTSEGCSSCPPADALLAELEGGRHGVVALSEHVDYWDDLGWRDPFSSGAFTARQRAYARRLGSSAIYTPQLVVGGRRGLLGSDRSAARAAITAAAADRPEGRVTARLAPGAPGELIIEASATWATGVPAEILVALVQDRATTRVARGENAGRTLAHVAVVRSMSALGRGVGAFSGRAALPRPPIAGAGHAVVFVQEGEGGAVLAAAAAPLP